HTISDRDWSSDVCSSDLEAHVLQLVEERDRHLVAEQVVAAADERGDLLLLELLVHESQRLGDDAVEQRPPHGCLDDLAVPAQAEIGRASCRERVSLWKAP